MARGIGDVGRETLVLFGDGDRSELVSILRCSVIEQTNISVIIAGRDLLVML